MFKSSISDVIRDNRSLFEDVNRHDNTRDNGEYTILDYGKIVNDMGDYLEGYFKYKESGDDKYADKLLSSTHKFYDDMFTDIKYRTPFNLNDMRDINKEFIKNTKRLQALLETDDYKDEKAKDEKESDSKEIKAVLKMTDNQYNKLMKVYKDDAKIYLWLATRYSPFRKSLDPKLHAAFENEKTPVIHRIKKTKDGD